MSAPVAFQRQFRPGENVTTQATIARTRGNAGIVLVPSGAVIAVLATWMFFVWAPIEATQGSIQRIYYVHVPVAWLTEFAFGMTALFGMGYLWLRDERADAAAVAAAEGGIFRAVVLLIVGPLWGRRVVNWRKAGQIKARVADMVAQLVEDGWREVARRSIVFGLVGRKLEFRRGDTARLLTVQRRLGRPDSLTLVES